MTWRDFLDRYALPLGIMCALALTVALLPGNVQEGRRVGDLTGVPGADGSFDGDVEAGVGDFSGPSTGAGRIASGAGSRSGSRSGTGGSGSSSEGSLSDGGSSVIPGEGPCRPDGRRSGISKYMPPCLRWAGGDNGGATAPGVSRDKVLVVRYLGQVDPGTQAILEQFRLADPPERRTRAYRAIVRYSNQHYETYGREVVLVDFPASGRTENEEAMRRDAAKIAEMKPFAVMTGTPDAPVATLLASELAHYGIVCMCTVSATRRYYLENPPYIFSSLPSITQMAAHHAEYIGKRLAGQPAQWAGDELNPAQGYRQTMRKFGLVYIEGVESWIDPDAKRGVEDLEAELAKYGVTLADRIPYRYEGGRNQQQVSTIIGRFKDKGVTTVIPYVDPLYPIFFTQEASRQQYFPEWFVTGTGLMDTTTAGRIYDQRQWRHAFGTSPLWVTWNTVARSPGYREFHHGMPGMQPGDEGVLVNIYRAYIQTLFRGIHMAGPNLTADTFAQGQYAFPATGGSPALPLVYLTRDLPTEIKDMVEVFYAFDERGRDERNEDGFGMMMKVDGGRRYQLGEWPDSDPTVFDKNGAVATSDNPPGGGDPPHEEDGHTHDGRCHSCP